MKPRAFRNRILPACLVPIAIAALAATGDRGRSGTATSGASPVTPHETGVSAPPAVPMTDSPAARPATRTAHAAATVHTGMVVAIDPETGELGLPNAEQRANMTAAVPALTRSAPGVFREIRSASGAVGIDLGGRLQEFAVVQLGPDGKPVFGCVRPTGDAVARPDSMAPPLEVQ